MHVITVECNQQRIQHAHLTLMFFIFKQLLPVVRPCPDREEPTINHILTSLATLLLSTASNQRIHRPDLLPQVVENKSVSAKNTGICFKAKKTHNA